MAGFRGPANGFVDVDMVPHPAVSMLFDLGKDGVVVVDGSGRQKRNRVVAGLAPNGVRGRGLTASFECLQVRMSPLVSHAILGPSPELAGEVVALDELWGHDAARVHEQLRAARSWDERFEIAGAALARRYDDRWSVDAEVGFVWRRMVGSRGWVRVERLASEIGWGRKRLWSEFRSQIGITPKRAADLIRFDHAAHRLAAGHRAAFVAAESGYADQSHLHREAMAFAGVTPASLAVAPFLAVDDVAWAAGEDPTKS